ncbi:hypothetical protein HD554DRAFT_2037833 [Boletus coccyginus]|nr:hypothetical protein HD554DRAFT_2037833 [Boletus coccyginus]
MPPKWRIIYDDESDSDGGSKRPKAQPELEVAESQVRQSSRNGRGSGGRIAQMRNLEEMQFASAVSKSKHVTYLEVATRGQEVNPMAPTSAPQSSEIDASRPRPRPRLKTKYRHTMSTQPSGHDGKSVQPSFALAAPSDQFGFKLPNTSQFESSAHSSGPPALGSQSGMEAPARVSRVEDIARGFKESSQVQSVSFDQHQNTSVAGAVSTWKDGSTSATQALPTSLPKAAATLFDEPPNAPELDSPPPSRIGLRQLASVHTLLMTDSQDNHLSEHRHDDNLEIDEVAPSEDEWIAEAALRDDGREASGFPASYTPAFTYSEPLFRPQASSQLDLERGRDQLQGSNLGLGCEQVQGDTDARDNVGDVTIRRQRNRVYEHPELQGTKGELGRKYPANLTLWSPDLQVWYSHKPGDPGLTLRPKARIPLNCSSMSRLFAT